ncbi:MAG: sporulation protein YqfD [Clostridia bacterium]|nr:sporulation protein YqfD [Clostridia bacterium]
MVPLIKGEITLRVRCLTPEKLLERAIALGAVFGEVRRPSARTLIVRCDAASAGILRGLCDRFSIPVEVLHRGGATALAGFAARRVTLPLGMALCVALCALFLGRLWFVDISVAGENASQSRADIRAVLTERGIRPGASRNVDGELLARIIEAEVPGLSHVSASLHGIRLLLDASGEEPVPGLYDIDAARDLVASRDGIVLSASARSGELCVQPGDVVRRGQLLIRGEERQTTEETRPIAALGEVMVRTWFVGEAELPLVHAKQTWTGRERFSSRLRILGMEWPLTEAAGFASERVDTEVLPIGGLFIPVEIVRERHRETRIEAEETDVGLVEQHLERLSMASAALRLAAEDASGFETLRTWVDYSTDGNALIARAVIEARTDAAVTRKTLGSGE